MLSSGHTTWYEQTLSIAIAMPPQKQTLLPQSRKYVTKLFICSHISRLNRASSRWGGENASPQKFFLEMSHIPHEANASRNQLNIVSIHHYLPTYLPTNLPTQVYLSLYLPIQDYLYLFLPTCMGSFQFVFIQVPRSIYLSLPNQDIATQVYFSLSLTSQVYLYLSLPTQVYLSMNLHTQVYFSLYLPN